MLFAITKVWADDDVPQATHYVESADHELVRKWVGNLNQGLEDRGISAYGFRWKEVIPSRAINEAALREQFQALERWQETRLAMHRATDEHQRQTDLCNTFLEIS
jgi:hypothetical protein